MHSSSQGPGFDEGAANCTFVSDIQSRIRALKLNSEKQFEDEDSKEYCVEHQITSEDIPDSIFVPEEEPNQKCSKYVLDMEEYIDLDDDNDSAYKDLENQSDSVDGGKTFIYEKADYILTEMNREHASQNFSQSDKMGDHKWKNTVQSSQKAIRSQTVPSVKVVINTSEIQPPPYTKQDQCNFFKSQFYRSDVNDTSDNLSVITETTEPTDDLTLNDLTTNADLEENEDIDDLANTSLDILSDNNFGSVMIKSPRLVKKAKLIRERGPQRKFHGEVGKDGTRKTSSKKKAVKSNVVSVVSPESSFGDRSYEGDKVVTSDINLTAQKTFQSTSKNNPNSDLNSLETESEKIINSEMTKTTMVGAIVKTKHSQNTTTSNVHLDNEKLNSVSTVDADADFFKLEVPIPKARKLVAVNKKEIGSDSDAGKQIKSSVCQEDLTAGSTLQYVSDKQTISTPDMGHVPITHDYHFHTVSEVKNGNSCSHLLSENSNAIYAEGKPSNPEDKFVISNVPDNEGNSQRIIAIKDQDDIEAPIKPPRSFIDTVKVDGYLDTHHVLMTAYNGHENTQAYSNTVKPGEFMNNSTGIKSNLSASKNSNIDELSDSHGNVDITGRLNTRKRDSGCILDDDCDLFTSEDIVGQQEEMEVVTENVDIKLSEKTTSCDSVIETKSDRNEYKTSINQEQLKSLELNDRKIGCKNCQTVPSIRIFTTNEIATNTEPLEDKVVDATNLNSGFCYVDVHATPTSDTPFSAAPSSATPTNNGYVNTCTNNGDGNKINKTVNSATNKREEEGLSYDPILSLVTPPSPYYNNSEKDYSEKPERETTDNLQFVTHNETTSIPSITVSTLPTISVTTTSSVSDLPISHTTDSGKLSVTTEGVSDEGTSSDNTPEHRASRQSRLSIPSLVLTSADDDSRESILSIYSDAGEINYGKIPVSGEVLLGVDYNYKTGALEIYVKQCKDLAPVDTKKNKSDPYIKTYLLPDKTRSGKRKTKIKKHTLNPTFDEVLRYNVSKSEVENRILWLTVWNNDKFGRNDFLGEVMLSLDCYSFGDPTPKWYLLQERLEEPQVGSLMPYKGDLVLSIKYVTPDQLEKESSKKLKTKKTKHQKGALQVMVKEARNLTAIRSNGTSDPFCKGYLLPDKHKSGKQKTPVVKKNCSPVWNYLFVFDDVLLDDLPERSLELTIWDHDTLSSNDFLGGIRFNLGMGIHEGKPVEWMDGRGEEIAIWQCMLDRPNTWIDACVNLRASMGKSGGKK
ncbi:uncharacterized protein LOC126810590 isoform X2 [Patella vulgata]|uniref:uncharacterized protein LOC126810590 isoform X2 n=1 Tax=Patella vulgata TaxID=6465 RepID=UPI00217FF2FB|nr:uncharacterized protein LOC126810590 isoform X2 [Patella vulgata]